MVALNTATGRSFRDADEALAYLRQMEEKMLDKNVSMLESSAATIEMVYTFRALDEYLSQGGRMPTSWLPR